MRKRLITLALASAMVLNTGVTPVLATSSQITQQENEVVEATQEMEVTSEESQEDSTEIVTIEDDFTTEATTETVIEETEEASTETESTETELDTEVTTEEEVTEEDSTETTEVDTTEVPEATAEDLYGKSYLFAIRDGVEIPGGESGFTHLTLNIYMADSLEAIYAVYQETDLEYVEENSEMQLLEEKDRTATNDRYYSKQKDYLSSISAQTFWSEKVKGSNTTIAVIDSGLYSNHADLNSAHILEGYNYVSNNTDTKDTAGHGTQVAGVIAAVRNNGIGVAGLLDDVNIVPLRISKDNSASPTIAAAAKAITDAVDVYKVDVINMSIGQTAENEALQTAVKYAYDNNVIMVAAAGNSGKAGETDPLLYPAAYEEVIGVGAVNADGELRENSQKNESVFVTAPGENIYTTDVNNKYTAKSGTSYSAPIVAAMAAAAKEKNPAVTIEEFKTLLQETSVDKGVEGYDTSYGYGVVNFKTFTEKLYNKTIADKETSGFETKYKRAYGSTLTDSFLAVEATKDGGYVAVGYTFKESTDPVWDYVITSESSPNANNDAIVVKFNSEAQIEWAKSFGTTGVDLLSDVAVTGDGTIVAVGRGPCDFGTGKTTASGYMLRINPSNPEDYEEVRLGGSAGDYLEGITATKDGGYVIAGYTSSKDSNDWTKVNTKSTTADGVIVKYDADGNKVFAKAYNNNDKRSRFFSVAEDADGNLIAVGDSQELKFVYNSQIVKFDGQTGEVIWARSEGSALKAAPANANEGHTSVFEDIAVLSDGTYVVTGTTRTSESGTAGEHNWGITGEIDGLAVHYDKGGSILSAENIGTINGTVDLSSVYATMDGGYILCGQTAYTPYDSDKYDWTITGATDTILLKYSANDMLEWNQNYGIENKGVWFNDMVQNPDGTFFIAGESNWRNSNGKVDAAVWTSYDVAGDPEKQSSEDVEEDPVLADGTFEGRGIGFNEDAEIVVSVIIEEGKIKEVKLVEHQDTASYMRKAKQLLETLTGRTNAKVDSITGASYSSNGLKSAVKDALEKSAKKATVKTYRITYQTNQGTLSGNYPDSFDADMENALDLSKVIPTRKGYTFAGWYTDKNFKNGKVDCIAVGSSEDVTLYAKWTADKYKIQYKNVSGAKNSNPTSYQITTNTITLKSLSRTGYTFNGWYSDSKLKTKVTAIKKGSTGAKTLYAKWTANKYNVTFVGGKGATGKMSKLTGRTYDKKFALTANKFKKKGYTFKGWATKKGSTKVTYKNKASVKNLTAKNNGTVTLYAVWVKNKK